MDENFAVVDDKSTGNSKFRKIEFLKLDPGTVTIRILESKATKKYTHFLNFSSVECLGNGCLICENNKNILFEHPEDYREVKGWSPKRERFWVNVLHKSSDGTSEVKVLSGGPTLFEDFATIAKSIRTDGDDIVDIRGYDWTLVVKGVGRDREITAIPQFRGQVSIPEVKEGMLFDLSNCLPVITREEMADFLGGTSLKDIFSLRRATSQVVNGAGLEENISQEIQKSVDAIFKN